MKLSFTREQRSWGLTAFFVLAATAVFILLLINGSAILGAVRSVLSLFIPFYIGFAIAYLLNPIMSFWENKVLHRVQKPQMRRSLATIITYALFLLIAGGAIAYLVPRLLSSLTSLINEIPNYYSAFIENVDRFIEAHPGINELYTRYEPRINGALEKLLQFLSGYLGGLMPKIADATLQIGGAVIQTFVGIVISIYFLSGKEKLIAQCKKVLSLLFKKKDRYEKLLTVGRVTHEKTLHYLTARLLDSLIVAVITYLFMVIFRVPYALLHALIIGVFNTIPFFGSWLGAIPPALIILIVKPSMLLPYLIYIIILEQLDGNVIGPMLQGKQLGLSALWIIFAIFLFGGLFGFLGMVVGVPLFAVIYYFVHAAVNNGLHRQGKSANTADYAAPEDREIVEKSE